MSCLGDCISSIHQKKRFNTCSRIAQRPLKHVSMDVDQEHGCRVLAISPSLEGAMLFIERAYPSKYSTGVVYSSIPLPHRNAGFIYNSIHERKSNLLLTHLWTNNSTLHHLQSLLFCRDPFRGVRTTGCSRWVILPGSLTGLQAPSCRGFCLDRWRGVLKNFVNKRSIN